MANVKTENNAQEKNEKVKTEKKGFARKLGEWMASITLKDVALGIVKVVVPAAAGFGTKALIDARHAKKDAAIECEFTEAQVQEPVSYMSITSDTNAQ